jgi:ubiquinone/menaquinone biosynthesis C-methylase UbiE
MGKQVERIEQERSHFDLLAEQFGEVGSYRKTAAGLRRMRRRGRMVTELLRGNTNPYVLEIGIGAGALSQFILEELPSLRLLGYDISPKCVEIAREKYCRKYKNAHFEVGDCTKLQHDDNTFDCVCGCSILHHLPLNSTLTECFRVLKPGHFIWFSEPNMLNPQIALEKNVKFLLRWLPSTEAETAFFRWAMVRSLYDAGFKNIQVRPFDFLHPYVPDPLIRIVGAIGKMLEQTPLLKEIAGSLVIQAQKP